MAYLRKRIAHFFSARAGALHNDDGAVVPRDRVVEEYDAIKSFLADRLSKGQIVAIQLPHHYRYLLCVLACIDLGLPFLPLSPSWPRARVEQIRQSSKFALLIDASSIDEMCRRSQRTRMSPLDVDTKGEDPLYVIYTSGSTGEPKGVVIPRRAYTNFVTWLADYFRPSDSNHRMLSVTNFTFDVSLLDVGLLLTKPIDVFFSRSDGNVFKLASELEQFEISLLNTVPNNATLLMQEGVRERVNLDKLDYLLLGGSRFPLSTYRRLRGKLKPATNIYNFYGPTEMTVYSHVRQLAGDDTDVSNDNVTIGKPIANVSCTLVDEQGAVITTPGRPGELLLGGAQLMQGYYGDPDLTNTALTRHDSSTYYRSGDVGFFDRNGNYFVTGRKDETLKRRGFRVNLLDIDSYIQRLESVQDCMVLAYPDAASDHILLAAIIPRSQPDRAALRAQMKEQLLEYQVPDLIEFVESFPVNDSGKVSRRALMERFQRAVVQSFPSCKAS